MKKLLPALLIAVVAALYSLAEHPRDAAPADAASAVESIDNGALLQAIASQAQDRRIEGAGEVVKLLADDDKGSRHQRFIVRVAPGKTVLIAHNIDLAPRVAALREGDVVSFSGEYVWNSRGGVVHWTHRDPRGRHAGGWIRHDGRLFQ